MPGDELAVLLGHDAIAALLAEQLEDSASSIVRLTGAAGSGKSYIARQVAAGWRETGGRCVVAVGDDEHSSRALYPLLTGLSRAHRDWVGLASIGARSAIRVADVAARTGGAGTLIFEALAGVFRQETQRVLRPYTPLERDVILDLKRFSRSRRVLLIADNAHWWDAESLRLLGDVLSATLREVIPQLCSVTALLVDTADEQSVAAPEAFDLLTAGCGGPRTIRTSRCTRVQFPDVLRAFGVTGDLPEAIVTELFGVTHGHLKLAEQIAASGELRSLGASAFSIDDAYLSTLVAERLASLGSFTPEVTDLLARAALFGLSCAEQDLGCVTDRRLAELRPLVERAVSIGFIERVAEEITFSHEVIRSAILGEQAPSYMEDMYLKLASCLGTLRPGDYDARAQALLRGGAPGQAREMVALAGVARLRIGVQSDDVLRRAALQLPDDPALLTYLEVVAAGYKAVATGDFATTVSRLRTPLAGETTAMAAERNYIAAICALGRQTRAEAESVAGALQSWVAAVQDEFELALRFLVLLQQAQVLSERFDEARATETLIEQKLTARARYDVDAAAMIQVQNRRAGALMTPEVAEDRIGSAVGFFRRGTGKPGRDQLELFRSLTNLAAIEIRLGKDEEAYGHATEAEWLTIESFDIGHRLDVLASNLVLAGYRSGHVSLEETIAHQTVVARSPDASEDNFIQRCNLAAYLLLASRDDEAAEELDALGEKLRTDEIDETYLVYYWTALTVARAAVRGDAEEAMRIHLGMDAFVDELRWPCASYIRRRQRLLTDALPTLRDNMPRATADTVLLDRQPLQIGRAWPYYGRLIPCVELSFWSDS